MPVRQFLAGPFLVLTLAVGAPAFAAPEIFGLDPETGPAGTHVTIQGKGLRTTQHVGFAVGRTVKPARFRVNADDRLEVIAPDYYRPQAAATVAVFTQDGVVVAMPAAGQTIRTSARGRNANEAGATFYHVMAGGVLGDAGSVAVIEGGGVVERGTTPGMQFVKRGGMLLDYHNPNGIVFHEPGAIFGPAIARSRTPLTFIAVPRVSVSPGVGPFVYQNVPRPAIDDKSMIPPEIRSISPLAAAAGDIVILTGRGFLRTTSVQFKEVHSAPRQVGFRVVSDRELRVEVPDETPRTGPQLILVSTTEGVTVTIPRDRAIRAVYPVPRAIVPEFPFYWLASGDVAPIDGRGAVYVENRGLLTRARGGCLLFVKKGGRVGDDVRAEGVYYEAGAILSDGLKNEPTAQEVAHIVPSFMPSPFMVLPGPIFRR